MCTQKRGKARCRVCCSREIIRHSACKSVGTFLSTIFSHLRPLAMPLCKHFHLINCKDTKFVHLSGLHGHLLLQSAELLHSMHFMHGTDTQLSIIYVQAQSLYVCHDQPCSNKRHKRTWTCMNRIVPPESIARSPGSAVTRCPRLCSQLGCAVRRPRAAAAAGDVDLLVRGAASGWRERLLSLPHRGAETTAEPPEGFFALAGQACGMLRVITCTMLRKDPGRASGLIACSFFCNKVNMQSNLKPIQDLCVAWCRLLHAAFHMPAQQERRSPQV